MPQKEQVKSNKQAPRGGEATRGCIGTKNACSKKDHESLESNECK